MILEVFLQSVQSKVYSYVKNNTCTHCVHIPNSIYSLKIIVSVRDRLEGGAIRERETIINQHYYLTSTQADTSDKHTQRRGL